MLAGEPQACSEGDGDGVSEPEGGAEACLDGAGVVFEDDDEQGAAERSAGSLEDVALGGGVGSWSMGTAEYAAGMAAGPDIRGRYRGMNSRNSTASRLAWPPGKTMLWPALAMMMP